MTPSRLRSKPWCEIKLGSLFGPFQILSKDVRREIFCIFYVSLLNIPADFQRERKRSDGQFFLQLCCFSGASMWKPPKTLLLLLLQESCFLRPDATGEQGIRCLKAECILNNIFASLGQKFFSITITYSIHFYTNSTCRCYKYETVSAHLRTALMFHNQGVRLV